MIRARFLGFELETVKDEVALERASQTVYLPMMERLSWAEMEADPSAPIVVREQVFELQRVLGLDDGGPLAIYRRVR